MYRGCTLLIFLLFSRCIFADDFIGDLIKPVMTVSPLMCKKPAVFTGYTLDVKCQLMGYGLSNVSCHEGSVESILELGEDGIYSMTCSLEATCVPSYVPLETTPETCKVGTTLLDCNATTSNWNNVSGSVDVSYTRAQLNGAAFAVLNQLGLLGENPIFDPKTDYISLMKKQDQRFGAQIARFLCADTKAAIRSVENTLLPKCKDLTNVIYPPNFSVQMQCCHFPPPPPAPIGGGSR